MPGLEKFKSVEDLAKSYLSNERSYSQDRNELSELRKFAQEIAPHWAAFEAWYAEQAGAQQERGQKGGKRAPQSDEELAMLKSEVSELHKAQMTQAIKTGALRFEQENPDAIQYKDEINAMIEDPNSPIAIRNFRDPDECHRALDMAYKLVKASKEGKRKAGSAAQGVAGGSMGQQAPGLDLWDDKVSSQDVLKMIQGEARR